MYYGAELRTVDEENQGFATTIADAAHAVTERLLGELASAGDQTAATPDARAVAADSPAPSFVPSSSLLWAWRQVRELDTVRNQLADRAPPSFETHWHLPELADRG